MRENQVEVISIIVQFSDGSSEMMTQDEDGDWTWYPEGETYGVCDDLEGLIWQIAQRKSVVADV